LKVPILTEGLLRNIYNIHNTDLQPVRGRLVVRNRQRRRCRRPYMRDS
jgi:hypothetical protein